MAEALPATEPEESAVGPAHRLQAGPDDRAFELHWTGVIAHAVRRESFATVPETDRPVAGRLVVRYEASAFLDFVRASNWGDDTYPGPVIHVAVFCLDLVVDVAALDLPTERPAEGAPLQH